MDENQPLDEIFFRQYRRYANNPEIKGILKDEGVTSCAQFITWLKGLEKSEVGILNEIECIDNPDGLGCGDDDDGNMFGD